MEQQQQHWENKVLIGCGNLRKFAEDYDLANKPDNQFVTASQLFPIDMDIDLSLDFERRYEWVIYIKKAPARDKNRVDISEEELRKVII